jgi:hypothetical protein
MTVLFYSSGILNTAAIPILEGKDWIAEGIINTSFGQPPVCFTSNSLVRQVDGLSSLDFTLLFMRVPLGNYYQCGLGGMGDRFDLVKPPSNSIIDSKENH